MSQIPSEDGQEQEHPESQASWQSMPKAMADPGTAVPSTPEGFLAHLKAGIVLLSPCCQRELLCPGPL